MKNKIIETVKKLKLITKSNKFLHPHCVILGYKFTNLKDLDDYEDYHLNHKYINSSINIKYHTEFLKLVELWFEKKNYYFPIQKEYFQEFPFLDKEFKIIFQDDKKIFNKKNRFSANLFISPDLNFNFYNKAFHEFVISSRFIVIILMKIHFLLKISNLIILSGSLIQMGKRFQQIN